jgi:hypothetical protein
MNQSVTGPLAERATGDVLATSTFLSTCDADTRPGPARAGTTGAKDINIRGTALDGTVDVAKRQARDRHTVGRSACRGTVLVILLDDDAVFANVGERDIFVGNGGDGAGGFVDGLNAYAVLGVGHGRGRDGDVFYGIVAAAADGADGEAMSARADAICESDALFKELDDIVGRGGRGLTVPELIARQSSWFLTFAPVMTMLELLPTSKASVLWPPKVSPAKLSMVIPLIVKPLALLIENT